MPTVDDDATAQRRAVEAWAAAGLMWLTGHEDGGALGPPAPLVERLGAVTTALAGATGRLGRPVVIDALQVLGERAAIARLHRRGRTSSGGGTRLLRTDDGWLAVSLARPDDLDLVPAWLGLDAVVDEDRIWEVVSAAVATRPTDELVSRGSLLGLAVGSLPAPVTSPGAGSLPVVATRLGDAPPTTALDQVLVVDLSSLWAGPLCGSLLADAGARVVKVESTGRPDGARLGPPAFFDLLNAGKASVAVDLATAAGRDQLRMLVERADVVIEASRPRALEQLGIDARAVLAEARPRVWVSITGHGRGEGRDRVGFGDDAAVAGGLVCWDGDEPVFCADAVADPASGLVAATAVLEALSRGGRWLLDVSLSGVAAHLAGPTLPTPDDVVVRRPRARPARGVARRFGADTDAVLAEIGVRS